MTWNVEIERRASRELRKLDRPVQNRILGFLRTRVATQDDPRRLSKALAGPLSSVWRYRIGDYRLFCAIEDRERSCVFCGSGGATSGAADAVEIVDYH